MDLTIVITTYNRAIVLDKLLDHLEKQTDREFQVVVAIDGSVDGTEKMLSRKNLKYDLKWIDTKCSGYGLALARNRGILAADGKAVVIIDDDSTPCSNFVDAHKKSVAMGVITGGPRKPSDCNDSRLNWKMQELDKLPFFTPVYIKEIKQNWPNVYLVENNICLFRQDWIDIGLFSERLKMYGFIGQEFFARAEFLGYSYQYNPEASVVHNGHLEGDNGLRRRKKQRQTRVAAAIRPSLMRSSHYRAQVAWARQFALGNVDHSLLPPFRFYAGLAFPYRYLKNSASVFKKTVFKTLRRYI